MPTYHYRCNNCGHEFDQFQKFAEDPLTNCPDCQGSIKRVVQPVGIVFKGSGWYINDSRDTKSKTSSSDSGTSKETDSTSKTEPAKPAKDPAPKEKAPVAASKASDA